MSDLVLAATDRPLAIRVSRIEDDRVPGGSIGFGTYLNDHLIARCAVSAEVAEFVEANRLFEEPAQLVLAAREAPPGLQCQLFAVVTVMPPDPEGQPEPWAASVPGAGYEESVDDNSPLEGGQGMFFLGQIVRFDRDRKHPDNLGLEAADLLRKLIEGATSEVVDRVLEDLLDGDPSP